MTDACEGIMQQLKEVKWVSHLVTVFQPLGLSVTIGRWNKQQMDAQPEEIMI